MPARSSEITGLGHSVSVEEGEHVARRGTRPEVACRGSAETEILLRHHRRAGHVGHDRGAVIGDDDLDLADAFLRAHGRNHLREAVRVVVVGNNDTDHAHTSRHCATTSSHP